MNASVTIGSNKTSPSAADYEKLSRRLQSLNYNRSALAVWLGISQQAVSKWATRGVSAVSRPAIAAAIARPIDWIDGGSDWTSGLPLDFTRDRVFWRNAENESFAIQVVPSPAALEGDLQKDYLRVLSAAHQAMRGPAHSFTDELTLVEYVQRAVSLPDLTVERRHVSRGLQPAERFTSSTFEPDLVICASDQVVAAVAIRAATRWVNATGLAPAYAGQPDDVPPPAPEVKTYTATADFPDFGVRAGDTLTVSPPGDTISKGLYVLRVASGAEQTFFVEAPVFGQQYTIYPGPGPRCHPATLDWLHDSMLGRVVHRAGAVP